MTSLIISLKILDSGVCTFKLIVFDISWLAVGGPWMCNTVLCFSPRACLNMHNFLDFLNSATN